MKISVTNVPAAELECDALVLAIPADSRRPSPWESVDAVVDGALGRVVEGPAFRGKAGQVHAVSTLGRAPAREIILVGLGTSGDPDPESWRRAVGAGCREARSRGASHAAVPLPAGQEDAAARLAGATAEAAILASYRFQEYRADDDERVDLEEVTIATAAAGAEAAARRAATVAASTCWARDLVNRPGNAKRPFMLAELALEMADAEGLGSELLDHERCEELGMNALLAVGSGSDAPPRIVVLEHAPEGAEGPPVVLVGKGVTFDSGGISIKPSKNMGDMKGDMAGAAAVYGTMQALARLDVPRRVVGVTPLAENLPSSTSYRPGDIVRAFNGKTIEVVNTDAEGRLILADALAWAAERFTPGAMVDLATLTGACVVALGSAAAGLMGTDDELCEALLEAGEATGERVWRLPAWDDYDRLIDTDVADVKNSGGREAGVLTAGKFLQRFVGDTPWAHLDIAGPAFLSKARPYTPRGGTGFGVRLLTHWLSG